MAHDHSHADANAYYLEQIFTIAVCGALGCVAVLLWYSGKLTLMLAPKFHVWVLAGGITLLVLVVIRAIAVWRSVEEPTAVPVHDHDHDHDHAGCGHVHGHCHHEHHHEQGVQTAAQVTGVTATTSLPLSAPPHEHTHDHDHDHDHSHDHSHDHGHDHGWAPWRYVVLLLPVVLYFLNLPNQAFSSGAGDLFRGVEVKLDTAVQSTGTAQVGFAQLQQASLTAEHRAYYEGKTVSLTGKYSGDDYKRFTLIRYKRACCAADAVPLNAVIMLDPASAERLDPDQMRNKWVDVTGRIHFINRPGTNEYITALVLYPTKDEPLNKLVRVIPQPANPFLD
jgi:uncharacterized membrane protein YcgQ (UPF0703/DUF1980 family)